MPPLPKRRRSRARQNKRMAHNAPTRILTSQCPNCGNARVANGAEGHVFIHPGIRGIADVPTQQDWRGPMARIKITGLGYLYR